LVADSSFDGIIVDCVASAILSADAFSFVLFAICRKGGLFFLLSPHANGTEVKQLIFYQRRKNNE
jgi:hypothetical protein